MKITLQRICIEVGCCNGHATRAIHDRFSLPIFGFEPHPRSFSIATEVTKDLQPPVKIFQMTVAGENNDSSVALNESRRFEGTHSILPFRPNSELDRVDIQFSGQTTYDVPCTRLDTFLEGQGIKDPSELVIEYIRVDAQGIDLEVLLSLGRFLKCVRAGILETVAHSDTSICTDQKNTLQSCTKTLLESGFSTVHASPNFTLGEYNIRFSR